jgi:hypothetical protein
MQGGQLSPAVSTRVPRLPHLANLLPFLLGDGRAVGWLAYAPLHSGFC